MGLSDVLTFITGVVSGVLITGLSQFLVKLFLEPLQEFRSEIAQVHRILMYHRSTLTTPIGRTPRNAAAAKDDLLTSASALVAKMQLIPIYSAIQFLSTLPSRRNVNDTAVSLRALSSYVVEIPPRDIGKHIDAVLVRISQIERLLRLPTIP